MPVGRVHADSEYYLKDTPTLTRVFSSPYTQVAAVFVQIGNIATAHSQTIELVAKEAIIGKRRS